jgi:hypothetical protein
MDVHIGSALPLSNCTFISQRPASSAQRLLSGHGPQGMNPNRCPAGFPGGH